MDEAVDRDGPAAEELARLGWTPGRVCSEVDRWESELVRSDPYFVPLPAAHAFLVQFGGLVRRAWSPGTRHARGPFALVPTLAMGEGDRFATHAHVIGSRLYPVGEYGDGRSFIGVGEHGGMFLVDESLLELGHATGAGLTRMLLGL